MVAPVIETEDAADSKGSRRLPYLEVFLHALRLLVLRIRRKSAVLILLVTVSLTFVVYVTLIRPYQYTLRLHADLCPDKVRIGSSGDGGWWTCDLATIAAQSSTPCVVYSFGLRDNFSFDHDISQKHSCTVHGFDPSSSVDQSAYEKPVPDVFFHGYGVGKASGEYGPGEVPFRWPGIDFLRASNTQPWTLRSFPSILKSLGHAHVHVVKIDIEGGEWDVLPDIAAASWDELYMEVHFPPWQYQFEDIRGDFWISRRQPYARRSVSPPAQNVDGPVDRIQILRQISKVADLFHWDRNTPECFELYFKRRRP